MNDKPVKLPAVAVAWRFASITTAPFTVSIEEPDWNAMLREARNVAAPLPANARFVFASTTMSSSPGDAASFDKSISSDRPAPSVMSLSNRAVSLPAPPLIVQLPVYAGSTLAIAIVSLPIPESIVSDVDGFANRTTGVDVDETNSICSPLLSARSLSVTVSSPICEANTRAVASRLSMTAADTDIVISEAASGPGPSGSSVTCRDVVLHCVCVIVSNRPVDDPRRNSTVSAVGAVPDVAPLNVKLPPGIGLPFEKSITSESSAPTPLIVRLIADATASL